VRRASLAAVEVTELDGYRVTSLERTALDIARSVSYERAVAVLDGALHAKADASLLAEIADAGRYRTGAAAARRALAFADGRAESVGESISRVRMSEVRLPAPDLQFNVFDRNGTWVARVDFVWPDHGVVGEFDGRLKYTGPPEEVAAAVMKEKARQQDIEAVGWLVARWSWSNLNNREQFRARISATLEKGRRLRERSSG
jgi:very-short-patch-repair endonuclease